MRTSSSTMKIWDIRKTTSTLKTGRMPYNAISTSRMLGKEKSTAFQKILNEIRHREPSMMFMNPKISQD